MESGCLHATDQGNSIRAPKADRWRLTRHNQVGVGDRIHIAAGVFDAQLHGIAARGKVNSGGMLQNRGNSIAKIPEISKPGAGAGIVEGNHQRRTAGCGSSRKRGILAKGQTAKQQQQYAEAGVDF